LAVLAAEVRVAVDREHETIPPDEQVCVALRFALRRETQSKNRVPITGEFARSAVDLRRDVHVAVNVLQDAEVPDETGSLDAPEAPLALFRGGLLEEAQVQLLEPAIGLDDLHDLVGIFLAERRQDVAHHLRQQVLLVLRHLAVAQARLAILGLLEADRTDPLAGVLLDDGHLPLLLRQGIEHALGGLALVEEQVGRAPAVWRVAVVDGSAPGRAILGIAVAADREMMTGHQERILALAWIAENVRPDVGEIAAAVPLLLAIIPADLLPALFAGAHRLDDTLHQFRLGLGVD